MGIGFYNNTLPVMQQICEKLLKSVLLDFNIEEPDSILMRSHKVHRLYEKTKSNFNNTCDIRVGDLAWLTKFYFDCKYPGDNFIMANKEQEDTAYEIVEEIVNYVNDIRRNPIPKNNGNQTNYFGD